MKLSQNMTTVIQEPESQIEKLTRKGRILTEVCKNIRSLRKIDDRTLLLNNNNLNAIRRYVGFGNLLNYDYPSSRKVNANSEFEKRSMTKQTFEEMLKNAMYYYQRASKDPNHWDMGVFRKYRELEEFSKEHEATPYSDKPLVERQRYQSRDLTLAEWEEYKRTHLNNGGEQ